MNKTVRDFTELFKRTSKHPQVHPTYLPYWLSNSIVSVQNGTVLTVLTSQRRQRDQLYRHHAHFK
jgi:hypothetical protein